jgi:biotin carboxyl carrier protein
MKDKLKSQEGEAPELKPLNVLGDIYYTTFTRKYQNKKPWAKKNAKEVVSFIPGTVREVLIKEGDTVELEQKLLILEAMKMMNTIYSPGTGKIKSIKVNVGDCIPKGTVLIEFE